MPETLNDVMQRLDRLGETALAIKAERDNLRAEVDDLREILHDILVTEQELEHAPYALMPKIKERKAAEWARAWEKFEP